MLNLHYYRTLDGKRLCFRDSEIVGLPFINMDTRRVELSTIYGSTYIVNSVVAETVIEDSIRFDPFHHVFHWTPVQEK